ncbi:MAG TPA: hypothetical protein VKQ34_05180 [Candidatus Saccharimonadales bacterium]|nr:hypothetical protein [Candidatus Saccharimonadales bacterium]
MCKSKGYNGWSNYETWVVALWLNNDPASYNALEAIKAEDESEYHKAESLEELVRELYEFEPVGIVADLVNSAFAQVNWAEIVTER